MGWAVGWDREHNRWLGYGVPCKCEHPDCDEDIDRGLSYRCGDLSDDGCAQFFCSAHLSWAYDDEGMIELSEYFLCERCIHNMEAEARGDFNDWLPPFPVKPDTEEWATHLLTDESWAQWRAKNPGQVEAYYAIVAK